MSAGATLVTGQGGLIGGAVIRRLLTEKRSLVAVDREIPSGLSYPAFRQDLPDPHRWHDLIARFGITKVIHSGGISGPMVLPDNPAQVCAVNLQALIDLLEAARIQKLERVVWFSSINAYGPREDLGPVSEDTPLRPDTVYGASKAAGEAVLQAYHAEHGVDAIALRVASCYGPGRTTSCLIRTLIEDGLAGRPTPVRERPDRTRQHVFIDDVVDAVFAALDRPALPRRIYNVGPGSAQNLEEIVGDLRRAGIDATVEPRDVGFPWNTFPLGPLAIDAARRDLGFEPRTGFTAGAIRTRAWIEGKEFSG